MEITFIRKNYAYLQSLHKPVSNRPFQLSLLSPITEGQLPDFRYHVCPNTTTFTTDSPYKANRNSVLSCLLSNGTRGNGFYNTTSGRSPDMLYGLFLCRGDLSSRDCQECVTFATSEILRSCPVETTAVVWYDNCLLRYSNQNIFSVVDEAPVLYMCNLQNITEQDRFNQLVLDTMRDAATQAANEPAVAKKFATKEASFSSFQTLYTLVQCTPDLSGTDCELCLREAMAYLLNWCSGKQGGRVMHPSCNFRYEIYQFYDQTAVPAPTPSPSPGLSSQHDH